MNAKTVKVTPALLAAWPLPAPAGGEGKESRGRVLVVGGSRTVAGAVLLAGTAALRVGAGKLQLATAEEAAIPLGIAMPEAMVLGLPTDSHGELRRTTSALLHAAEDTDALVIGPGMRTGPPAVHIVSALGKVRAAPVVLDAGALPALAQLREACAEPLPCVVTPHAGEMAGVLDLPIGAVMDDAAGIARAFAREHEVVTVLKGETTFIAATDGTLWKHTGGCIGLGTSGSGDVLAGAIGGLLARGATVEQAAVWAVYLHGKAGERLSRRCGKLGFLAREIAAELPLAFPG